MVFAVHHALLHRHLVFGADRDPVLFSALLCAAVGYAMPSLRTFVVMIILEGAFLLAMRALARKDPWFVPVMRRTWRMQGHVPARAPARMPIA